MALNRGYKLQEFVAHASDVNCVSIGKKSSRVFVTGGEDRKVNLWAIGKPTPLLSLSGHMGSVQSVAFDSAEVLVLGGSSNGIIKLWDLEEAKIVRTLTGHRSNCTSVEFHPFGEFFASGSLDTDLKIWDIRKKGCIHTYKGHTGGIRKIRFTPDGRWVVTGGADNMVKLWDLTAGKLLHDFKFHNGQIRCIDFHPHEFLLATGSADQTVKFWDLETFELIGSAGPEATGVCSMIFHPDGKTLFCGLDTTLKVFSWEPIRCHDVVDMGWSTLGDLSIYEGKLLGCSYYESRVGVWVADISLIAPYALGVVPKANGLAEPAYIAGENLSLELKESSKKSSMTPTTDHHEIGIKPKEIERGTSLNSDDCGRNIARVGTNSAYPSNATPMPSSGVRRNKTSGSCVTGPQRSDSRMSSKASSASSTTSTAVKAIRGSLNPSNRSERSLSSRNIAFSSSTTKAISLVTSKKGPMVDASAGTHVTVPVIIPRDNPDQDSLRVATATSDAFSHGLRSSELTHRRKPSFAAADSKGQMFENATINLSDKRSNSDVDLKLFSGLAASHEAAEADDKEHANTRNFAEKLERVMSIGHSVQSQNDNGDELSCSSSETNSVKYVRGVAVQLGKTRSLVERWERREKCNSSNMAIKESGQTSERDLTTAEDDLIPEILAQNRDAFVNSLKSRLTKLQMVRHFWEQNGIKGAIGAAAKLPDYSVQVDVISILKEKVDVFTLDLFSNLLPILVGLLNSKIERHIIVSLGLLLELVKIFKPVIISTVSSSSTVGVDLQAEQRLERCTHCFTHLEKIKQILPPLIRRGGLLAKHAGELNLVLHTHDQ